MLNKNSSIFIAGHNGMVGSAILRVLKKNKFRNILTVEKKKLNFLNQEKTFKFLNKKKPEYVVVCAAVVGGIDYNRKFKSKFLYENLQIQNNLIHGAYKAGTKNLIFLGSSCMYPKNTKIPIKEDQLLSGILEETNDAYVLAKISGLKLCEYYSKNFNVNYKTLMPCNIYGPGDNYDLKKSHFYPALIKKIYLARKNKKQIIEIWGTGSPKREILYVDDLANAILFFMNIKMKDYYINIGSGKEFSITWYAKFIMKILNSKFKINFNKSMPDGVKSKLINSSKARKYGWKPKVNLKQGLLNTIENLKISL
jgi:GDP-L-fucose synthase